jgi:hypothetical protein
LKNGHLDLKEFDMNNDLPTKLQLSRLKSKTGLKILVIWAGTLMIALLAGCNLPNQDTHKSSEDLMASMVASTLQAMNPTVEFAATQMNTSDGTSNPAVESQTPTLPTPSVTPNSTKGKVSGLVCYIQIGSTNLVVYFQRSDTSQVTELPVVVSNYQSPYSIELEPGNYIAYAWTSDFSIGGSYSTCGSASGCSNATPLQFSVTAGQTLDKIDICDWSHGPFDVPFPPGFDTTVKLGVISGGVYGYPYGSLPQLTIVAFNKATGYRYWVGTTTGQSYFSMSEIPAGTYQVVAYDSAGHAGGSLVDVIVTGGNTANADINDWSGSYPPNPFK